MMSDFVPASEELATFTQQLQATFPDTDDEETLVAARTARRAILAEIGAELATPPGWLIARWAFEQGIERSIVDE